MSDGLIPYDRSTQDPERSGPVAPATSVRTVLLQVVVVLAVFVAAGAICGVIWWWVWTPPSGTVVNQGWYPGESGLRGQFRGTGWYVVLSVVAGLLLGVLTSWLLDHAELATLAAVLVGAVLAAVLMREVGQHLGPPDPTVLARTTSRTTLPGDLRVTGTAPLVAFPLASLLGLCLVFLLSSGWARSAQD